MLALEPASLLNQIFVACPVDGTFPLDIHILTLETNKVALVSDKICTANFGHSFEIFGEESQRERLELAILFAGNFVMGRIC